MTEPVTIPEEAVQTAARALFDATWREGDWRWEQYPEGSTPWVAHARVALEAAAPAILAAERERIAQAIEDRHEKAKAAHYRSALRVAARIARGES